MKKKVTSLLAAFTAFLCLTLPASAATNVIDSSQASLQLEVSNPYTDIENWGEDANLPQEMVYVFPSGTTIQVSGEVSRISAAVYPAGAKGGYEYDDLTYATYEAGQTFTVTGSYTKLELIIGDEVRDYIFVRSSGSAAPDVNDPVVTPPTVQPGTDSPFTDVATGVYYFDSVSWAVDQGITTGTSATTFSPDSTCTRGQIITFLWRADGSEEPEYTDSFTDVSADIYYFKATQWAHELGVETLDPEGPFAPDGSCTRAMAVEFMWRLAGSPEVSESIPFTDVAANASYAPAVAWALSTGVTSGTSATTFSPDTTCTRGQIVTFLYRAFA